MHTYVHINTSFHCYSPVGWLCGRLFCAKYLSQAMLLPIQLLVRRSVIQSRHKLIGVLPTRRFYSCQQVAILSLWHSCCVVAAFKLGAYVGANVARLLTLVFKYVQARKSEVLQWKYSQPSIFLIFFSLTNY